MTRHALALDLGGTKIAAAIVADDGRPIHYRQMRTPTGGAQRIAEGLAHVGRTVLHLAQEDGIKPVAVGIGTAGVVDQETGRIRYASDNLPGWTGFPLVGWLEQVFGLPVAADNDVNAMAFGELTHGAARELRHVLFLTVGTGIGGALIFNRQLWTGVSGTAGEIGYMAVDGYRPIADRRNHLEEHASGKGMARAYRREIGSAEITPLQEVARRAHADPPDEQARRVIKQGAALLGNHLAGVLGFVDVEAVVIGGGVPDMGAIWWEPLHSAVRAAPLPNVQQIQILPAALGAHAGLIGAGALALAKAASF